MGNWNSIHKNFWSNIPNDLSSNARLLFIYLLTCDSISIAGYLNWNPPLFSFQIRIDENSLEDAAKELESFNLLIRNNFKAYLPDKDKNDTPRNPSMQKAYERDIEFHDAGTMLARCRHDDRMMPASSGIGIGLGNGIGNGSGSGMVGGVKGGKPKKPKTVKPPKPPAEISPAKEFTDWMFLEYERIHGAKPGWASHSYIQSMTEYPLIAQAHDLDMIQKVAQFYLDLDTSKEENRYFKGHPPHLLLRNFQRFYEDFQKRGFRPRLVQRDLLA